MASEIHLYGAICGAIWWPVGAKCGKPIHVNLSREMGRFTDKPTLRDLLDTVLMENGGDFQSASLTVDSEIVAVRHEAGRTVSRSWPITAFRSVSDMVDEGTCSYDFTSDEDGDE